MSPPQTITVAFTGASGLPYGVRLVECLLQAGCRVWLLYSQVAQIVARQEMDWNLPARPAEVEADRHDISARHAVLYNRLGMPVAAGRLLQHAPGVGRIGRMAVDRSVRGAQWGRQLLDALVDAARARGDAEVQLHAQRSAEGFYRRAGFAVVGEPYEEAGIAHIAMTRKL